MGLKHDTAENMIVEYASQLEPDRFYKSDTFVYDMPSIYDHWEIKDALTSLVKQGKAKQFGTQDRYKILPIPTAPKLS